MISNLTAFKSFPKESRVWLYQTNRALTSTEKNYIEEELQKFTKEWAAHGKRLWANAALIHPYFIAVVVDETVTPPSGCSIDASVHFIKALGKEMDIDFFTRLKVTYLDNEMVHQVDFQSLSELSKEVLIYDPLVNNLKALREDWPSLISRSSFAHLI